MENDIEPGKEITISWLQQGAEVCKESIAGVRDGLYVLKGKWKLRLIVALAGGPLRFKDIQRSVGEISSKILAKELKELELNEFVERKEYPTSPVTITYQLTPYSQSIDKVMHELIVWGIKHRERIVASRKK